MFSGTLSIVSHVQPVLSSVPTHISDEPSPPVSPEIPPSGFASIPLPLSSTRHIPPASFSVWQVSASVRLPSNVVLPE